MKNISRWLAVSTLLWSYVGVAWAGQGAPQQFATFSECKLINGQTISPCRIGYRTFGTLNADKTNVLLVPTSATAVSSDYAYLASPALLDPEKYFIVIVDALANGVSTSPSNSATQANGQFPQISITDMVESQHRLLTETLGVESLYAIVGISMGGMQAFEWAVRYPGFAQKMVSAIGSPRFATYDIVMWSTLNRLLALYRQCQCKQASEAIAGLWMLTSVPTKLGQDIPREDTVQTISIASEQSAMSVGKSWDIQRQSEAVIGHNIAREFNNDMAKAAAQIDAEFLIVVAKDDRVVTPQPARDIAPLIGVKVVEFDENCGHADPWCAPGAFARTLSGFLNSD